MAFLAAPLLGVGLRQARCRGVTILRASATWRRREVYAGVAVATRAISAAATSKVAKIIQAEFKHENTEYEQAKEIKQFLSSTSFKLVETDGVMCLIPGPSS